MFFLYALCITFINKEDDFTLDPGFYKIDLIGGQGGDAHKGGGYPARIRGTIQLKQISRIKLVGGSNGNGQSPGLHGGGGKAADKYGGAGGGYSSITANEVLIAMAGGGGGGGHKRFGLSAGGFDINSGLSYYYKYLPSGNVERTNYTQEDVKRGHNGGDGTGNGNGINSFGGSGGGGGYVGGQGGHQYSSQATLLISQNSIYQMGSGGSSFVNMSYFVNTPEIIDGQDYLRIGLEREKALIEPITVCADNCLDCDIHNGNKCKECARGKVLNSNNQCVDPSPPPSDPNPPPPSTGDTTHDSDDSTNANNNNNNNNNDNNDNNSSHDSNDSTNNDNNNDSTHDSDNSSNNNNNSTHNSTNSSNNDDPSHETEKTNITQSGPDISISQIGVNQGSGSGDRQLTQPTNDDKKKGFQWWIIAAIVGGVALIALVIGIIACKRMKKEESASMEPENVEDFNGANTTTVTVDNPLYQDAEANEDPFKNDFEDEPKSDVFEQKDIEEIEDSKAVEP